jgi:hypothetical protein
MTTDAPRRLTRDELRPLLHEFARSWVRQVGSPPILAGGAAWCRTSRRTSTASSLSRACRP